MGLEPDWSAMSSGTGGLGFVEDVGDIGVERTRDGTGYWSAAPPSEGVRECPCLRTPGSRDSIAAALAIVGDGEGK